MDPANLKDALRTTVYAARADVTDDRWRTEDETRTARILEWTGTLPAGVAAVYASRQGEPDTAALITALAEAGWRVLLPVIRRDVDWAWFEGWDRMAAGWRGIPQPTGPRLGAEALVRATLILVPCLGIGRDGTRLGTGGGWYDRALLHAVPDAVVGTLVNEREVVDAVPVEPWDLPVDVVVTERRVLRTGAVRPRA